MRQPTASASRWARGRPDIISLVVWQGMEAGRDRHRRRACRRGGADAGAGRLASKNTARSGQDYQNCAAVANTRFDLVIRLSPRSTAIVREPVFARRETSPQ